MFDGLRRRLTRGSRGEPIVVVSGLPRSGTSMMMNMLAAGGLEILADGERAADVDNPKGYFELERIKHLERETDKSYLRAARGKAVKVISFLIKELPDENDYRVLFMRRDLDEVLASQQKMIERLESQDADATTEAMKEAFRNDIARVRVDSEATFAKLKEFAEFFVPRLSNLIELYTEPRPIFDVYGIDDEIDRALHRKVPLKSGGHVVFDQTEAMTTIDVNTGGYVGHRNLEETIFRTNLEAAAAIARQLRLRNLGGIIIIDFIDMTEEEHRRQVLQTLTDRLAGDHAKSHVMNVSPLGLVEMTRRRNRESLEHVLCQPCPSCEGRGFVKTAETVCHEIFREILRQHRQFDFQEVFVLARPQVIERLLDEDSAGVAELEGVTGKPIRLQSEGLYSPDQFDVVLM